MRNPGARVSNVWAVVIAAAVTASMAMGIRQTFGLFLLPLGAEQGISAVALGLSVALHNLTWGLVQPITGALGDRHGAGRVAAVGGLLYVAGLGLVALHPSAVTAVLGIGIMTGIGVGCTGTGSVVAAVGRAASPEQRGSMMGIAAAGGSVGQALLVPYAQIGIGWYGAAAALGAMGLAALMILPAARVMEWNPRNPAAPRRPLSDLPRFAREALRERDFALLTLGFFACGFQLAFLTTHLPAHLALCGMPVWLGATSLMLVGLFNIPGSWLCGKLGNVIRPEVALGGIYLLRTVAIALFALLPVTEWGTLLFAAVLGSIWLGSVPLTAAAIARRFGVADLGALYGVCFFNHQIGGFLGAGAAALLVDRTGSYAAFWPVMILVGLGAVAVNWATRGPIRATAPA
ncbi:Predicted arabinose efflux permease, MFS family [Roseomonas rosea]|uniref:Predicted arabinose efflux permease, MFS family n=1 Tax=Muricoccus roseus TaxID=198092 RepID=A0A1M6PFM5_9PROT|nr:MFS transporter [Roseomonas rosea]SHK06697.1 Predicted arabinose efflux permease, MFS family [Roseomonas rosea]